MAADAEAGLGQPQAEELARFQRRIIAVGAGLLVTIVVACAALVALIDTARTDDMQKLALLGTLAGLVGGATASLVELYGSVGSGFLLSDGTPVLRGREARWHSDELRRYEERCRWREKQGVDSDEPPPQPSAIGLLSSSDIPVIVVNPLIGGVLGLITFAGVVGGFLVASSASASYSCAALVFIAFLGGFFSAKFLRRLGAAADALFGTEQPQPPKQPQRPDEPERQPPGSAQR
jgi:hypothetical protein